MHLENCPVDTLLVLFHQEEEEEDDGEEGRRGRERIVR